MFKGRPLGIVGGTFDPIHLGHLHVALSSAQALGLHEIRLIPAANPLLRAPPQATAEQRLAMVKLAIANHPQLTVDDCEIRRDGHSYAIDTLLTLREQFPDIPFYYIIGVEQFSQFTHWHRWQEILETTHLVVTTRAGFKFKPQDVLLKLLKQRQVQDVKELSLTLAGNILLLNIVPLALSATEIRKKIMQGENPEVYLPDEVAAYIKKQQLYVSPAK